MNERIFWRVRKLTVDKRSVILILTLSNLVLKQACQTRVATDPTTTSLWLIKTLAFYLWLIQFFERVRWKSALPEHQP